MSISQQPKDTKNLDLKNLTRITQVKSDPALDEPSSLTVRVRYPGASAEPLQCLLGHHQCQNTVLVSFLTLTPLKVPSTKKLIWARLGVSRTST